MLYIEKLMKSGEKGIDVILNSKDVPKLATDIANIIITLKYKNLAKLARKYLDNFERLTVEDLIRAESISESKAEDFLYLLFILFMAVTLITEISEKGQYTFTISKFFEKKLKKKIKSKSVY